MPKYEVRAVVNRGVFLTACIPWLYAAPKRKQTESESSDHIIGRFMLGQYDAITFHKDNRLTGCMIYAAKGDICKSKLLFFKHEMVKYLDVFMAAVKKAGYKSFEFESIHSTGVWRRVYDGYELKKRYACYRVPVK